MINVIVNADDFGLAPEINRAICSLFNKEAIGSASLFACTPYTEEAVSALPERYYNRLGIHLCLNDEAPVCSPSEIPSLLDPTTGCLKRRLRMLRDISLGLVSLNEIKKELSAQINRLRHLGIQPVHADTHYHIHAWPPLARVVAEVCRAHGISSIRHSQEWLWGFSGTKVFRLFLAAAISACAAHAYRRFYNDFNKTERFTGLLWSGNFTRVQAEKLCHALVSRKPSSIEIMCHPGFDGVYLHSCGGDGGYAWKQEYDTVVYLKELFDAEPAITMTYHGAPAEGEAPAS